MSILEPIKPGVMVRASSFGGGWAWPIDAAGKQALWEFFGEGPAAIPVADAEGSGYIIEDYQGADLADHLQRSGVMWEIG